MSGLIFVTDDLTKRADHPRVYIASTASRGAWTHDEITSEDGTAAIHQLVSRRSRNRRRTSDGPKNRTVIGPSIKDVLEEEVSRAGLLSSLSSRATICVTYIGDDLPSITRQLRCSSIYARHPIMCKYVVVPRNCVNAASRRMDYCAIAVASGGPEACNSLLRQIHWTLDRV